MKSRLILDARDQPLDMIEPELDWQDLEAAAKARGHIAKLLARDGLKPSWEKECDV